METTEAPVSQSIKLSYKGIEVLVTQRDLNVKMLPFLEQAQKLIDGALTMGFTPPPQKSFGQKKDLVYAEHPCPMCSAKVVIQTNKDGKKVEKCETQKYDFTTKTTSGCAYFKWL